MRKILSASLALLVLVSMLSLPASAAELDYDELYERGITPYGIHDFQEGLMPAIVDDTWNYINEKMEVVDLNRGRFEYVYDFYEGLAAVVSMDDTKPGLNGKVGYINTKGDLVIPCQYDARFEMGEVWTGRFRNGQASVLKCDSQHMNWEVGRIDKSGSLVQGFQPVGEWYGSGYYLIADDGNSTDDFEYEVPSAEPEDPKDSITFQFDDDYFESDVGPINDVTFTNNTDERVTGVYSLLYYSPEAHCSACRNRGSKHVDEVTACLYAIDLDLAPGESVTKHMYFGSYGQLTHMNFVWVEYDDAAERATYFDKAGNHSGPTCPDDSYLSYLFVDTEYLAQYPYNITFAPLTHKK